MFSLVWAIVQGVIWAAALIFRLLFFILQALWDLALNLIPPLAERFGESHEKNKRKILIESVPAEKWGECFNRLLEYRDLCFGENNADARSFDGNVSVRYQMEQAIKDEFGMDIGKYMKNNDVDKLNLLILDMEQYILGNIKPSKKYQKTNGSFGSKKNKSEKNYNAQQQYSSANTGFNSKSTTDKWDNYGENFKQARYSETQQHNNPTMPSGYFADCKSRAEIQQRFTELSNTFNPDYGSNPNETMYQNILEQYRHTNEFLGRR